MSDKLEPLARKMAEIRETELENMCGRLFKMIEDVKIGYQRKYGNQG